MYSFPAPNVSQSRQMITIRAHEEFPNNIEISYEEYLKNFMQFLSELKDEDKKNVLHSRNVFSFVRNNIRYFSIEVLKNKTNYEQSYYGKII